MTWKPTANMDEKIREWMKAKGWDVTATDYHFDQEIYAWRHQQRGGKSPTLRITRHVLEHFPAFAILHHLDRLKVAAAIRAEPGVRLVLIQEDADVVLKEIPPS
jgi:hypothetical protein